MTRLMCSTDREELETLKSKLFRAGIRSEIRTNSLAYALGINRVEILVHERDLLKASEVRQRLETANGTNPTADRLGGAGRNNGFVEAEEPEVVIEAEAPLAPAAEPEPEETPGRAQPTDGTEPEGELDQATALLEKEVGDLLDREAKLVDRCRSLEEKVEALDGSLAQAKADLDREAVNCSGA